MPLTSAGSNSMSLVRPVFAKILQAIRTHAIPISVTIFALLITGIYFLHYVGTKRFGNLYWTLQPSAIFGLSSAEAAQGLTPLYRNRPGEWGFDGQCYYRISNDPFILDDVKAHLDAAGYRYQRIFPSLLARLLSLLAFQRFVTPGFYYGTIYLLFGMGVLALSIYLRRAGESALWAFPWALFFGTQYSLWTGTVDAAGDSLLILSVLAIVLKRDWLYAAAMSAACLTRETFGLVAAGFWVHAVFQYVSRSRKPAPALIRLVPLAALVSWNLYVRSRLIPLPLSQILNAVNLPFRAMFAAFGARLPGTEISAGLLALYLYAALAVLGVAVTYQLIRIQSDLVSLFPYTVLLACVGAGVMSDHGNYLRISSVLLAIMAICLPYLKGGTRTASVAVLTGSMLVGFLLAYMYERDTVPVPPTAYNSSIPGAPLKPARASYNCRLKVEGLRVRPDVTIPFGRFFTPPYLVADVEGRNLSESELRRNLDPSGKATYLAYRWVDGAGRRILTPQPLRSSLPNDIPPNGDFSGHILVFPPNAPGNYELRLSMIDEGEAEFDLAGNCVAVVPLSVGRFDVVPR